MPREFSWEGDLAAVALIPLKSLPRPVSHKNVAVPVVQSRTCLSKQKEMQYALPEAPHPWKGVRFQRAELEFPSCEKLGGAH